MKQPKNRLQSVLIIGATPAGVAAANKLGELGVPITLVDTAADLDRKLAVEEYRLDSGVPFNFAHRPGLIRILGNSNIRCAMPAVIRSVKHSPQGFRARIDLEPTYVDPGRCTLCGQCAAVCPVCRDDGHRPIQINDRMALPGRAVLDKRRMPPCQADCPLGVNVQGYMALAGAGRFDEALELIRMDNVLPGVCGRICTHPCEVACRRSEKDQSIAIRSIKRFLADRAEPERKPRLRPHGRSPAERIAVVGAGPAGLAAAVDLARAGYPVTIYEKEKAAGGLLRFGIGPHRLPRDILDREVAAVRVEEGVEIVCGHPITIPHGLVELRKNHRAVIVATGSWADRRLGVPGETLKGVDGCVSFLTRYYRGEIRAPAGEVAVIGDGNAAFDLARVLHRLGASVTIVSWFGVDEIPADREEVHAALAEGISIQDRCQVVGFHGSNGRLRALRLQATRPGRAHADGICWPELVSGSPILERAFDHAFLAIGQSGAYGSVSAEEGLRVTAGGLLEVDGDGRTGMQGVYATGDAATGATSVVQAMAHGRKTAARVVEDLGGRLAKDLRPAVTRPSARDFDPIDADLPQKSRAVMPELPLEQRRSGFAEVEVGFDESLTRSEAARCLQCGSCAQCLACVTACADSQAIRHGDQSSTVMENAGVLIIADPQMAPRINGEDVIRAYGPPTAKTDVHAMMLRGFAAAAQAMVLLQRNGMRLKGHGVAFVPPDPGLGKEIRVGVFACRCNDSFGWTDEMDEFMQGLKMEADVVHAEVLSSACISEGIQRMVDSVRDRGLTRLVVASCVCCPLNFVCSACTDQRSRLKRGLFEGTGISRSMVQTCNLRGEVLRLVEKDRDTAVRLFKGIITRSIGRARKLKAFPAPARSYNFTTAVIGQTEASRSAALTLARAGVEVLMFGSAKNPLVETPAQPSVFALDGSTVDAISGRLGNFQIHARFGETFRTFSVGGVILGEKSRNIAIYRQHEDLPEVKVQSQMQKGEITGVPYMYPCTTSISGLFLADPPGIQISKRTKGEAVAVLAAAAMPRGPRQSRGFSVVVKESLCRGCGRCLNACLYQAVSLKKRTDGSMTAVVDDVLCKGCGNCISVCPSNAADSPFRDQIYLEETIEELLT